MARRELGPATLAVVQAGEQDFFYLSSLDERVRPKRFYFQPGERAYRVELVYEHDAWRNDTRVTVPRWRIGRATSLDEAVAPHMAHVERAFNLQPWETRSDVLPWMRNIALVTTAVQLYMAFALVLFYFDLRRRQEGLDLEAAIRQMRGPEGTPPAVAG